jgi:membrane-associated protein
MLLLSIIDSLREILRNPSEFFEPEKLIRVGGLTLLVLLTYAQTGLFFCFFIPGDAILITAGVFAATGNLDTQILVVFLLLAAAAFAGNITGYFIGRKAGSFIRYSNDRWFCKRNYLYAAEQFYLKHGRAAISLGMFFILVRTFSPILAGLIGMKAGTMAAFSLAGAVLWVGALLFAGYFLGQITFVERYLEFFILAILLALPLPALIRYLLHRRKKPPSNHQSRAN